MSMQSAIRDRPLDITQLPFNQQKVFFKLDQQFDSVFVNQHLSKVNLKNDPLKKALNANLIRDRQQNFKQFVVDEKYRKFEFTAKKGAERQSNQKMRTLPV